MKSAMKSARVLFCTFLFLCSVFFGDAEAFQAPLPVKQQENKAQDEPNEAPTSVDDWISVKPTGARATLRMPKKPRYIERTFSPVKNEPPIRVRLHMATLKKGLITYTFAYHDLHKKPANQKVINQTLDAAMSGSYTNVMGQLLLEPEEIKYEIEDNRAHPGREFIYVCRQNDKKYVVCARIILVENRQYQISCLMEESEFDKEHATKYLNTFQLINPEHESTDQPKAAE